MASPFFRNYSSQRGLCTKPCSFDAFRSRSVLEDEVNCARDDAWIGRLPGDCTKQPPVFLACLTSPHAATRQRHQSKACPQGLKTRLVFVLDPLGGSMFVDRRVALGLEPIGPRIPWQETKPSGSRNMGRILSELGSELWCSGSV